MGKRPARSLGARCCSRPAPSRTGRCARWRRCSSRRSCSPPCRCAARGAPGRWRGSGFVFALLSLTRPEGPFVFGVFTAALALAERWQRGDWSHLRRHLANALVVLGVVATHFAWRWHYYGELLPNTYYAKVTGGAGQLATGLRYLREFSLAFPLFAASLAFPLALLSRPLRARLAEPAFALVIYATLPPTSSTSSPSAPTSCPTSGSSCRCCRSARCWRRACCAASRAAHGPVVLALFALQAAAGLATEQPYRAFVAHRTAQVGERVGAWLAERLAPDDWIAVNTAGSLPYVSRLPTIDMLGLTDAQIAHRPIYIVSEGWAGHRRGWGEYVLRRRPRVILWYNSAGLAEPHYLSDHELADDPLFRFFYTLRVAMLPPARSRAGRRAAALPGISVRLRPVGRFLDSRSRAPPAIPRLAARSDEPPGGPLRVVTSSSMRATASYGRRRLRLRGDPRAFVEMIAARWAAQDQPAGDPAARAEVEALCAQALRAIEAGSREEAKRILSHAAELNGRARSRWSRSTSRIWP